MFYLASLLHLIYELATFYSRSILILTQMLNSLGNFIQVLYSFIQSYWLAIIILIILVSYLVQRFINKPQKQDYQYLTNLLQSNNPRLPAACVNDLVTRIAGKNYTAEDANQILEAINNDIDSIIERINPNSKHNVILIDSPWGTGKTTDVLLAIERIEQTDKSDRRYIYESAFKYADVTTEFTKAILLAINGVLSELNIVNTTPVFEKMIKTLDTDPSKTMLSIIKEFFTFSNNTSLSYELIQKVNDKYDDSHLRTCIYVIIDDLDRLLGEDIHKVLSLLSIIRRFKFVKIIIPAELAIVIEQLENIKVSQPEKFVQKYLPEVSTIKLKTNYDIIEMIALRKIKSTQKNKINDNTEYCAAWAAVLLKLFSNILNTDSRKWPSYYTMDDKTTDNDLKRSKACQAILQSSIKHISTISQTVRDGSNRLMYHRTSNRYDARRIEDILLSIEHMLTKQKSSTEFTDDDYWNIIANWIFAFADKNWQELNIGIRDVMGTLDSIQHIDNLSQDKAEQFAQTFNALFPDKHITVNHTPATNT